MALAEHESQNPMLRVDFDAQEDVLYISLGTPVPSHADEAADGLLLRRSNESDSPSGVTALDFRHNWRGRQSKFYSLVAEYLHVPVGAVERATENAV